MSTPAHRVLQSYEEYIAIERFSNLRHEYWDGQIYAMAGSTYEHARIAAAATAMLYMQLRGSRCGVASSDLRIRTKSGLSTYGDITVVYGPSQTDSEDRVAITNPTLIVEVLSPSTESYDRGDKFEHYKTLDSFQQYVLVSERDRTVEVWTRDEDRTWRFAIFREGEFAQLSVGATLDVRELLQAAEQPAS